jgi:hypothetical protein
LLNNIYHRLLNRQIKNNLSEELIENPQVQEFLKVINKAYSDFDEDKHILENILENTNKYYRLLGVGQNSYNNQTLLIPQTGGVLVTRVNGTLADSSGNVNINTSGVGGSGTINFVPKWSASTTLQNSQIFDSVNVGINTTSPAYKLDVNGMGRFRNDLYADSDLIVNNYFTINTTADSFPIPNGLLGIWRKRGNGNSTYFLEDEQGAAKDKWAFVKRQGYDQIREWFQTNSSIVNINYVYFLNEYLKLISFFHHIDYI